jgi:hypothetical protein
VLISAFGDLGDGRDAVERLVHARDFLFTVEAAGHVLVKRYVGCMTSSSRSHTAAREVAITQRITWAAQRMKCTRSSIFT